MMSGRGTPLGPANVRISRTAGARRRNQSTSPHKLRCRTSVSSTPRCDAHTGDSWPAPARPHDTVGFNGVRMARGPAIGVVADRHDGALLGPDIRSRTWPHLELMPLKPEDGSASGRCL